MKKSSSSSLHKKVSHFLDFATAFFGLSSASLLDFFFSELLLYFLIFVFKLLQPT